MAGERWAHSLKTLFSHTSMNTMHTKSHLHLHDTHTENLHNEVWHNVCMQKKFLYIPALKYVLLEFLYACHHRKKISAIKRSAMPSMESALFNFI